MVGFVSSARTFLPKTCKFPGSFPFNSTKHGLLPSEIPGSGVVTFPKKKPARLKAWPGLIDPTAFSWGGGRNRHWPTPNPKVPSNQPKPLKAINHNQKQIHQPKKNKGFNPLQPPTPLSNPTKATTPLLKPNKSGKASPPLHFPSVCQRALAGRRASQGPGKELAPLSTVSTDQTPIGWEPPALKPNLVRNMGQRETMKGKLGNFGRNLATWKQKGNNEKVVAALEKSCFARLPL